MTPDTLTDHLTRFINFRSLENGSGTPDFILAEYITDCLIAFERAVQKREKWYGRGPKPCPPPESDRCAGPQLSPKQEEPCPTSPPPRPGTEGEMGCTRAGPGRGDCLHFLGDPGMREVDPYGKPEGWCWSCWKDYKIIKLEDQLKLALTRANQAEAAAHRAQQQVNKLPTNPYATTTALAKTAIYKAFEQIAQEGLGASEKRWNKVLPDK